VISQQFAIAFAPPYNPHVDAIGNVLTKDVKGSSVLKAVAIEHLVPVQNKDSFYCDWIRDTGGSFDILLERSTD
jgi:hypothetical protein